ncbi:alpha/beta-type small acid-soluble spore protein [Clostridium thermarum]|uniref:alpha/beta-type small acid-soluble spore protein n=1 Tax=Clostridium thermarum TaxID=1716543 RepID=UPI00111DD2DC|nr:alpha/beta-type small acid-soluble spore protein [Clostridium thermarum]
MASKGSRKLVPEAKHGLYKFRTEVAKEMGVPFSDYNGHLSARECGAVGGEMVKRMVADYEKNLK